jgi:hypothetical protein
MDMPQIELTCAGAPSNLSDAPSSFRPWNREALARIFQAIDGCSQGEAEMQIDALVAEFQGFTEPRHPLHLRRARS